LSQFLPIGETMARESSFQSHVIARLRDLIGDDGFVFAMDGNYIQGFPDVLILYKGKWAALECKKSSKEPFQPNQEYYIDLIDSLSFCRVIYPSIENEVFNDLQQALRLW
jgi:hypothetical protein